MKTGSGQPSSTMIAGRTTVPRLVVTLLTLVVPLVGHAGRAVSQPAAAAPLPAVNYPSRDPDTSPAPAGPPAATPWPAPYAEQDPSNQYYYDNGVWGYRDRFHHFHPMPARAPSRMLEHPHAGPHYATVLPNAPPRPIVVQHFTPPGRSSPR